MTHTVRGQLRYDVSMAKYTSWRTGGRARCTFSPADLNDLAVFIAQLPVDEALLWVGLGSNLLIRDGGFAGTVVLVAPGLGSWSVTDDAVFIAECGVTCAKVARNSARANLVGAEFLAGIPGTVGGALAMNAGAFGGETWGVVSAVQTMDRNGAIHRRAPEEFEVSYRTVVNPREEWFVGAEFSLQTGDGDRAARRIRALLDRRNDAQPIGEHSCGSVFRNPEGDYAARLIESCGLKGHRIGGASISRRHANFIINEGTASAHDIERLITFIGDTVSGQCGVELEPEVRIVGEKK